MDGIDISMVKTNGLDLVRLNHNYYYEIQYGNKKKLIDILKNDLNLNIKNKENLNNFITNEHYKAIKDLGIVENCDLIGFHGQTIFHDPVNKSSIQLGNPNKLAQLLNKNVIFDFRSNDIDSGGQGAPLAPIYHKYIIEKSNLTLPTCILNIGGISNITYWDGKFLIGFDTGPGNALMDDYISTVLNKDFDLNGNVASEGNPIKDEIEKFLENTYFKKLPPKSLDRGAFLSIYIELIQKNYSIRDIMATLAEFTIETIALSLDLLPKKINNILITGGGCRNIHLMSRLKERLKINFIFETQLGSNFDYIEAELIAYLSARSFYNLPFTFPSTTGVSKPLSGGKLFKSL